MPTVQNFARHLLIVIVMMSAGASAEELTVFGGESFRPEIYKENGVAAGIIPTLLVRLSKDTGDTYNLVLLPWKRALSETNAGHGGITAFSWTEERALEFDYSDPLLDNPVYLTVLTSRINEFKTYSDINGKVIGVPLGVAFGSAFDNAVANKEFFIDADNGAVSRLKKLLHGRIDMATVGENELKTYASIDPELANNLSSFSIAPFKLLDDVLYLAFPKSMHKEPALRRFNKALADLKKSHEYHKIVTKFRPTQW